MVNTNPLFEGELVRLAPRDPDRDAEVESHWTHDPEYLRLIDDHPAIPRSPGYIKKRYDEEAKDKTHFFFAVRARADDRLLGFVGLKWIQWSNGVAFLTIAIPKPEDRGKGYGKDALGLILRYAFDELNLYRLAAATFEYNTRAIRFLEHAGFATEVRRRQAIHRDGRRWDALVLGILRDEWRAARVRPTHL